MSNEYRQLQRTKRRGRHCIFAIVDKLRSKVEKSAFCGCGSRDPISKKHNNRIVRRILKHELRKLQDQ